MPVVIIALALVCFLAAPVQADQWPAAINDLIKAARETGDEALAGQISDLARELYSSDVTDTDTDTDTVAADDGVAPGTENEEVAETPSGLVSLSAWQAEIEAGFGATTGDTQEQNLALAFRGTRTFSEIWQHKLGIRAALGRSDGRTDQQKATLDYQLDYRGWARAFMFTAFRAGHDRFSAFDYRLYVNAGAGYRFIDRQDLTWAVQLGPGVQYRALDDGGSQTDINAVGLSEFSWQILETLELGNITRLSAGSGDSRLENEFSLTTDLTQNLAGRFSVHVEVEPDAPTGDATLSTDTRATLLYKF